MPIQNITPTLVLDNQYNLTSGSNTINFKVQNADFSNFDITTNLLSQGFNISLADYNLDPNNSSTQMTNSALSLSSLTINSTNANLTGILEANGDYSLSLVFSPALFPVDRQFKMNFAVSTESIDIDGIAKVFFADTAYNTLYSSLATAQQEKFVKTGNENLDGVRSLEIRPNADTPASTLNNAIDSYKIAYADSTYESNIIINPKTYLDSGVTKNALYDSKAGAVHSERAGMLGASKNAAKISVKDHFILSDIIETQSGDKVNLIVKGNGDAAFSLENLIYKNGIHVGKESELIDKIKSVKFETTGTGDDVIDVTSSDTTRVSSAEHINVYAGIGNDYILANGLRDIYAEAGKDTVVLGSGVQKVYFSSTNFDSILNDSDITNSDIIYNFKVDEDKLVFNSKSTIGASNEASIIDITTYYDNATGATTIVYDSQENPALDMKVIVYAYNNSGSAITVSSSDIQYS